MAEEAVRAASWRRPAGASGSARLHGRALRNAGRRLVAPRPIGRRLLDWRAILRRGGHVPARLCGRSTSSREAGRRRRWPAATRGAARRRGGALAKSLPAVGAGGSDRQLPRQRARPTRSATAVLMAGSWPSRRASFADAPVRARSSAGLNCCSTAIATISAAARPAIRLRRCGSRRCGPPAAARREGQDRERRGVDISPAIRAPTANGCSPSSGRSGERIAGSKRPLAVARRSAAGRAGRRRRLAERVLPEARRDARSGVLHSIAFNISRVPRRAGSRR